MPRVEKTIVVYTRSVKRSRKHITNKIAMDHLHQSRTLMSVLRCLILPHITMPEIISISAHFTLQGAKLSSSTKFGLFSFTPWTVLILFTCLSIQAASAFKGQLSEFLLPYLFLAPGTILNRKTSRINSFIVSTVYPGDSISIETRKAIGYKGNMEHIYDFQKLKPIENSAFSPIFESGWGYH